MMTNLHPFFSHTRSHLTTKYRDTMQSHKTLNPKDKTQFNTWNKETQVTGHHEPLWKPEVKSGAPKG